MGNEFQNNNNSSVGLALIGAGNRLRGLFKRLLPREPNVRLTGVYDTSPEAVAAVQDEFGACKEYSSCEQAAGDPEVDWVAIGSYNAAHAEQIIAAVEGGKHVFCEKPLATTVEDCLRIQEALREYNKQFVLGLVLRYAPFYDKVKEICTDGTIGNILSMEFNETLSFNHGGYIMGGWRRFRDKAGPHMLEKCCHDMDIANWLTQSLPVQAASFGGRRFFKPENAYRAEEMGSDELDRPAFEAWRGPQEVSPFSGEGDMLDAQTAILEFANGVPASFHTNTASSLPERRFHIIGDHGTLRGDVLSGVIEYAPMRHAIAKYGRMQHTAPYNALRLPFSGSHGGGDDILMENLRQVMLQGAQPKAGIYEGITSAFTSLAIDEAQRSGQIVDLGPWWERAGITVGNRR
ncbi:MAG: Gfo/Idh/MocA family protein [Verrucomicrobiota bacterium]